MRLILTLLLTILVCSSDAGLAQRKTQSRNAVNSAVQPPKIKPMPPLSSLPDAPLPQNIGWTGVLNSNVHATMFIDLRLLNTNGKLSGQVFYRAVFNEGSGSWAVSGSYKNGQCTIKFGSETYKGVCTTNKFVGYNKFLGDINGILTVAIDGQARLDQTALQFPPFISFSGASFFTSGAKIDEGIRLDHKGGVFSGSKQDQFGTLRASGHAMDGICMLLIGTKFEYSGPCNRRSFSGDLLLSGKPWMRFDFAGAALNPTARGQVPSGSASTGCPPGYRTTVNNGQGSLACVREIKSGSGFTTTETCVRAREGQALQCRKQELQTEGFFDYFEGEPSKKKEEE